MQTEKFRWVICYCCEGHGKVDNPSFSDGFTGSEWNELDDEFLDEYRKGTYDVQCSVCKGSGKVKEPDISRMTFAEKRVLAAQRREAREDAEYRRQSAHEQRMGY
ncbi:hypothetical protein EX227_21365 [Providencia rettgeri]|uniref:Uncharacterized protein n=1 Tax=Providencia rettgeri TaxID=587 RepID=A0AAP2K2D8_PRORE|nr:hypothetical protein [Providencia rettgeri]ELI9034634.1 hypothetical protein [Morganella morganii]MBX6950020.1 hypothetical protein [Providencia rettgeri]MBX6957623.1 hypothetical protein [Providencia rettgeri]MBX6958519.1 hypothetical protein [Providencia rettgeri]MBX6974571.1 hypothetical protein [Providencia rettgeri]